MKKIFTVFVVIVSIISCSMYAKIPDHELEFIKKDNVSLTSNSSHHQHTSSGHTTSLSSRQQFERKMGPFRGPVREPGIYRPQQPQPPEDPKKPQPSLNELVVGGLGKGVSGISSGIQKAIEEQKIARRQTFTELCAERLPLAEAYTISQADAAELQAQATSVHELVNDRCVRNGIELTTYLRKIDNKYLYVRWIRALSKAKECPATCVIQAFEVTDLTQAKLHESGNGLAKYVVFEGTPAQQEIHQATVDVVEAGVHTADVYPYPEVISLTDTALVACDAAVECNKIGDTEKAILSVDFAARLVEGAYAVGKVLASGCHGVWDGACQGAKTAATQKALSLVSPTAALITNCVLAFGDIAITATTFITRVVIPRCSDLSENSTLSERFVHEVGKTYDYCCDVADSIKNMSYEQMAYHGGQFVGNLLVSGGFKEKLRSLADKAKAGVNGNKLGRLKDKTAALSEAVRHKLANSKVIADIREKWGPDFGSQFLNQTPQQLAKTARSVEQNWIDHQKKLKDFIANPDAYDNKGYLKTAKTIEEREHRIQRRIFDLEKQIKRQRAELDMVQELLE